jgi:hypothetical protein
MTTRLGESSKKFKEEEGLYYYLTILSLLEGVSVYELDLELKFQEKLENYEACSGIKKAIDEADYKTYSELKLIALELDSKYNL